MAGQKPEFRTTIAVRQRPVRDPLEAVRAPRRRELRRLLRDRGLAPDRANGMNLEELEAEAAKGSTYAGFAAIAKGGLRGQLGNETPRRAPRARAPRARSDSGFAPAPKIRDQVRGPDA